MKKRWNVLVFPGGIENGLEIYHSLRYCKEIQLFSASSNVPNQAFFVYKNNNILPDIREANFLDELNKVIENNSIDLLFPANSLVIDYLLQIRDKVKTKILLPDSEIVRLTRSKHKTIKILENTIPVPVIYNDISEILEFPVFAKPDFGYGAQGASLVKYINELHEVSFQDYVIQEHLPGKEYTVDCFSDENAKLLFSGGRERSRVRMATSMHAEVVDEKLEQLFAEYAEKILSVIPITGPWFFQLKQDADGQFKLLEIDIRIAGTMCFNRCRGVNFPLLAIYQFFGYKVDTLLNKEKLVLDRSLRNRYIFDYQYDTVYVDLDDTIIIHNKINEELIRFLFQCINNKKTIVLISKSLEDDKESYLKKWRINEIFDKKIWLKEEESKAEYITSKKAIYIDDSFSQRLEVATKIGIPTFDSSMIECLIDERY